MRAFIHSAALVSALASVFAMPAPAAALQTEFVSLGSDWRYLDDGSDQGGAWTAVALDDLGWASGPAHLGYGEANVVTTVSFGPDDGDKHITTYFRHTFEVTDPSAFTSLVLGIVRDDGAVVHLNGIEVARTNMPAGAIDFDTRAASTTGGDDETDVFEIEIDPLSLLSGLNAVAVEVHQASPGSSDLGFDLELTASDGGPLVTRGPYLQMTSDDSAVVRWRTDVPTDTRVYYGVAPGSLVSFADGAASTTEHEVSLGGLAAGTRHYYAVGTPTEILTGDDFDHYLDTSPVPGAVVDARIWILGDPGMGNASAAAVRNGYRQLAALRPADLILTLGDNAYETGTDAEYQAGLFDMYAEELRTTPLWPAIGDHDNSSFSATQSGPFFDSLSLPTAAEAGGVASGTEAYYSFDYGDVHFVCLDSYDSDRSADGDMLTWLIDDLTATTARWLVAYWHHTPYSKGSHDSDSGNPLIDMRANALPILEDFGVDLVLGGHSHSYERSALIDHHYGKSSTLAGSMIVDASDGDPSGEGGYVKSIDRAAHEGAVYVTAGVSASVSNGGSLNHPVMKTSLGELGSVIVDIDDDRMDVTFVGTDADALDAFRIDKTRITECGDGLRHPGEDCDDGNTVDGDCCPADCTFTEPCREARSSQLKITKRSDPDRDRLAWKWKRGAETTLEEFGTPAGTESYSLCLYDEGAEFTAPIRLAIPSGAGWNVSGGKRLQYKDGAGVNDGVKSVRLQAGSAGRSTLQLKAKRAAMGLPAAVAPDRLFAANAAFTVQLVSAPQGRCWSTFFQPSDVRTNAVDRFKAAE